MFQACLQALQTFPFVSTSLCQRSNRASPCLGSDFGSAEQEALALGQDQFGSSGTQLIHELLFFVVCEVEGLRKFHCW